MSRNCFENDLVWVPGSNPVPFSHDSITRMYDVIDNNDLYVLTYDVDTRTFTVGCPDAYVVQYEFSFMKGDDEDGRRD